jgi:hypothetical protein
MPPSLEFIALHLLVTYIFILTIFVGVNDMGQQFGKNNISANLLAIQEADVSGDGILDKVYLYGSKTGESDSSYVDNISVVIEDGYSGNTSIITPDFNAGYKPRLFLGDFTADGVEDIKLSMDSGGSGGYGYFYIYTFINNTPKEIFNFDRYNTIYQYKVDYIDLYRVAVYNINHDKLFILDLINKGNEYISQYYDEFGMLRKPIQGEVLAIGALVPFIQNEEINTYELLALQRIIGPINSDTLGYIENVLSWDGEEFVSTRMAALISGILLKPPME